ncbi:MAG TPA: hypothetical protein P5545_04115, partial [Bacteroidota bacterium]|nr:hypothetical protein [Bacteroidota bacterium]
MKNKLPILLLFIFLCSIQSNAKTYNISPDSSFKKPSDVVNIVEDGDTIAIQSGEYFEDVASWRKNNLTFI